MWKATSKDRYSIKYSNWNPGQPDYNKHREGCMNIWPNQGYKWNDLPCKWKTCFVCELEC